jgi:hypothetical protein
MARSWSLAFSSWDPASHMVGFVIDVHAWSIWRPVPEQECLPVLYLEEKRETAHCLYPVLTMTLTSNFWISQFNFVGHMETH